MRPVVEAHAGSNTGSTLSDPLTTCNITVPSGLVNSVLCIITEIRDMPTGPFTANTPTVDGSAVGVTAIIDAQSPLVGTRQTRQYAWYLKAPAAGTLAVSVDVSGATLGIVHAIALSSVDQTNPVRDAVSNTGDYDDTAGTPQPSNTINSDADDLIIHTVGCSDPAATLGGSTLIRSDAGTPGGASRQQMRSMETDGTGAAQVVTDSINLASGNEPFVALAISFRGAVSLSTEGQFPRGIESGIQRGVAC